LLGFYKSYNEALASDDHVQKTLVGDNADSKWNGKEGALWAKLHRMYPDSIEIVGTDGFSTRQKGQKKKRKTKGAKKEEL
jgi:hypothetical protein